MVGTSPRSRAPFATFFLTLFGLLALASPAVQAQEISGPQDWADPSDYSYGPWNVARWGCINVPGALFGDVFHPDCWGDPSAEDAKRINAKSTGHWIRAGLLTLTQLWQGVQYVREIVQSGKSWYTQVRSIIAGFGDDDPHMTVYRMKWATDRFDRRLDQSAKLAEQFQLPLPDNRYGKIDAVIARSLATAKEGEEAAIQSVDRAASMRMRLSNNEFTTMGIGYDAAGAAAGGLPPLPYDAPAGTESYYAGLPSDGNIPSGGGEGVDPAVMYQRATVMARGAQTSSMAAESDLTRQRSLIQTITAREKEYDRQQHWRAMYSSFTIF